MHVYECLRTYICVYVCLSVRIECPTRYRRRDFFLILPLAGGPLLRVATIRRTTDTHYRHIPLHFHTTNVLLFKFHCNIFNAWFSSEWDTLYLRMCICT